jgi:hypothetical protein
MESVKQNITIKSEPELKKLHEMIQSDPSVLDKNNSESDYDSDDYISTKEVENQKLEDTIRYLKLDLNNEQLKCIELEEKLMKEIAKNKMHETNINYTKECLQFLNSKYDFNTNISLSNIMDYNKEVIDMARQFFKIEREYNKIKQYNNIDMILKDNYDILVTFKFEEIRVSYYKTNNSLRKFKHVYNIIYMLIIINFMMFAYIFFN